MVDDRVRPGRGDGNRRTPVAPFHPGFSSHNTQWRNLTDGQPLTIRFPDDGLLTPADLAATVPNRILCDTVGATLERNSTRPETKALDQQNKPCRRDTTGVLRPAPTEAIRVIPTGKEVRNLERAGITEDPAHTLYTDPDHDAWKQTILPALRRLAPRLIPRGRPSRHQRTQLTRQAGELAAAALRQHNHQHTTPDDPEQACYLYLKTLEKRTCACGCGDQVTGRARYTAPSHRMRALRSRRG